jgi:nickel/cobalt transporter (NiCoT) family protein
MLISTPEGNSRTQLLGLYGGLLTFNVLSCLAAVAIFKGHPLLLGMAGLAYTLGLRHAVDADHIAAIDNATRKLMQEGKRPIAVGLFFSLGHSTVVVLGSMALALAAGRIGRQLDWFRVVGSTLGVAVSVVFLFAIALVNLLTLRSTLRAFRSASRGSPHTDDELHKLLAPSGLLVRLLRPLFRLITRSWHLYPIGLLFGLGFDTATEIGVLSISATQSARGLPLASTLLFPLLFTAGMSLIDTLDSTLMVGAYGWAFVNPARKLYYNIAITSISVFIAVLVGTVEALGLLAEHWNLSGPLWHLVGGLNRNFGALGYLIIAVFLAGWLISRSIYFRKRREDPCDTLAS